MHVPVAVLQSSRRLSHEPKRTSELHAAPVAAAGWQVPAPVARSRSQNSGDAHWRIVVHADPATFDGTTHVGVGEGAIVKQNEPASHSWPGCNAVQSAPAGMGAGFAAHVPAQH